MSGVYPKARETLYVAYPGAPDAMSDAARGEANRDRVMITLLALNFLLMAFFVVMTSIAGEQRATVVAPADAATAQTATNLVGDTSQARVLEEERRRAVDLLRASVAEVFAPVIAAEETWRARTVERIGNDRVDIEVPFALFANPDHIAEGDSILAGIAGVLGTGVRGYRTDLALRASHPETDVALLAQRLIAHGLAPASLSVGILKPVGGQASGEAMLRFSFLLLEDNDDVVVRLAGDERR
ncbi:MAG: hypothetical protein AB7E79_16705 [Rhodospirillaceae bacterium]